MTRQEHLDWCKQRALKYVDRGDLKNAYASMCSDLGKQWWDSQPPGYYARYDAYDGRQFIYT